MDDENKYVQKLLRKHEQSLRRMRELRQMSTRESIRCRKKKAEFDELVSEDGESALSDDSEEYEDAESDEDYVPGRRNSAIRNAWMTRAKKLKKKAKSEMKGEGKSGSESRKVKPSQLCLSAGVSTKDGGNLKKKRKRKRPKRIVDPEFKPTAEDEQAALEDEEEASKPKNSTKRKLTHKKRKSKSFRKPCTSTGAGGTGLEHRGRPDVKTMKPLLP
eukprot:CAMPEP_0114498164 /NCGR_PEP_ID=MMETSP0109-20121206/6727_1 /TAXON_ID=29199 /ORGANISM="Chlorarachnion reptans, Strain CCCM449" /LENGTH=216 /DNA_ID=CAMNT_0001675625 /DNA_START=531 /DNA_END=1181 /DNA_ORIENTATION=-